jgi:hypothetical protein
VSLVRRQPLAVWIAATPARYTVTISPGMYAVSVLSTSAGTVGDGVVPASPPPPCAAKRAAAGTLTYRSAYSVPRDAMLKDTHPEYPMPPLGGVGGPQEYASARLHTLSPYHQRDLCPGSGREDVGLWETGVSCA